MPEIAVRPVTPTIGAEISGVDLNASIDADTRTHASGERAQGDIRQRDHMAIWDYWPATRSGYRVTIRGDRPR